MKTRSQDACFQVSLQGLTTCLGRAPLVLISGERKLPLLVNRNRGIEEILPLNYKYYIKSMNPLSITNQLLEIIQDEEYFKNITPSQREKIEKNYSVKASLHSFLNILAQ